MTEVKARLTLDTSDFERGSAKVDQTREQFQQKTDRRNAEAEAKEAARSKAAADREARRLADREAKEQAATERDAKRAAATVEREARRQADAEAREQSTAKRREERAQAEAAKAAERAARQAATAQRTAEQQVANENRRVAQRAGQLQLQLNDIFTSIGSGQNPLTVAIQQGPQITQIYGGLGATIAAIPKGLLLAGAAAAAFFGILAAGVSAAAETAQRQRQFNIELQATGNIAAVTAQRLDELVQIEAQRPGANRADTASSLGVFARNPAISAEETLARALGVARDLARVNQVELPASAQELNQSLDGTAAGARKLDAAYNILTAAEYEQIRLLDEQGRKVEIVNIVLAAAERRFKGLNEQGISPTSKYLNELGNAWTNFVDKVGQSKLARGTMWAGAQALKGGAMLFGGPPQQSPNAGVPDAKDGADAQESLRVAEARLAQLREQHGAARPEAKPWIQAEIDKANALVKDLQANVANLRAQTAGATEQQAAAQAQSVQAETERVKKAAQDTVAALNTVELQRRKLLADREKLSGYLQNGLVSPEDAKAAREAIQTIDGQLAALNTTAEKLHIDQVIEEKIAKLPPHLQPLERAFQAALKQGEAAGLKGAALIEFAEKARANVAQQLASQTQEQIALLGEEAQAALRVADAYGRSRAEGLRAAAIGAAGVAESQGQIAPGTAGAVARQQLEKQAAATVAAAAEKNRAYGEEIAALERLTAAEAQSVEAAREAERVNRVAAFAAELRAQAEASGSVAIVAAAERQIAKYDELSRKQLELDRRRAANQLNAQFDPDTAYAQQMAQLAELERTGVLTPRAVAEATRQYEQQRLESSRDATDGMIAGLRRYADEATNAGRAAGEGIASGMRTAEDAVVQFAMTGSFNFNQFANSVIADLVRVATRQAITGPLAKAAGSALSGIGDWLGGMFGGGSSGFNVPGIGTGTGYTYHAGGVAGDGGVPTRVLPLSAWQGAPRLHGGGISGGIPGLGANEVPTVLERGEEVLTADDPRHRGNLGRGGMPVLKLDVRLIDKTDKGTTIRAEQGVGPDGAPRLDVIVEMAERRMAENVARDRGALSSALKGTFGLQTVGRS